MADDNRPFDSKLPECFVEEFGLPGRRPGPTARAVAVAEAGPIEDDDAMLGEEKVGDPARVPVGAGDRVAVDQQDRAALTAVAVVEPHTVHDDERPLRGVSAFRAARH